MREKILIAVLFLIISCLFFTGCDSGIPTIPSPDQDSETSLGEDVVLVQNNNPQNNITFVLGKKNEDAIALLGEKDNEGNPINITGVIYVLEQGELFVLEPREDGLPKYVYDSNGNKIIFENYTESTVDITIYNSNNEIIQERTTENIDKTDLLELKNLYNIFSSKNSRSWTIQDTATAIKWGGRAISGVVCVSSIVGTGLSAGLLSPSVLLACGTPIVSTIASEFTETKADDYITSSIGLLSFATGDIVNGTVSALKVSNVVLKMTSLGFQESLHAPVILDLSADPSSIYIYEDTTITCNAHDEDGDTLSYTWTKTGGSFEGNTSPIWPNITWKAPSPAGTYTIGCEVSDGKGGTDNASVDIVVKDASSEPTIPTINYFNTTAEDSILSWSVANATSVTIDHGIGSVALTGTTAINPTTTTTYTLTATNVAGSSIATLTVTAD